MIISVVNAKGGVGKTTISAHLALWLREQGLRVAAVDADPQGSLSQWLEHAAADITLRRYCDIGTILDMTPRVNATHDVVVVDGPAALGPEIGAIVSLSDVALLPIGASMLDVWASYRMARLIYKMRFNPKRLGRPQAFTVLNRVHPNSRLATVASEAVRCFGFPTASQSLSSRMLFAEAAGLRTAVWRMGQRGAAAAQEILALFNELLELNCGDEQIGGELTAPLTTPRVEARLHCAERALTPQEMESIERFWNGITTPTTVKAADPTSCG